MSLQTTQETEQRVGGNYSRKHGFHAFQKVSTRRERSKKRTLGPIFMCEAAPCFTHGGTR